MNMNWAKIEENISDSLHYGNRWNFECACAWNWISFVVSSLDEWLIETSYESV